MINVKLIDVEDSESVILQESMQEGNECLLCQEDEEKFPNLSNITEVDIERYFSNEMESLIVELDLLMALTDGEIEKEHLDEIKSMCKRCASLKNSQIVFNPFIDRLKHDGEKWVKQ
jgi:hypothetical protein